MLIDRWGFGRTFPCGGEGGEPRITNMVMDAIIGVADAVGLVPPRRHPLSDILNCGRYGQFTTKIPVSNTHGF